MRVISHQDQENSYPLPIAARIAQIDTQTARRWIKGYDYTYKGSLRRSHPVPSLGQAEGSQTRDLTFEELLTLRLVKAFKDRGLGLITIKQAARKAATAYGVDNPFATQRFRSDVRSIFIDLDVNGPQRQLVNILTDQSEFREIVEPSLFQDVVFVHDNPREWWPLGQDHNVIIAPGRAFGAPHLADKGVRTDVVVDAVRAEGGTDRAIQTVANWFKLTENEVRDAIRFERDWLFPVAA